MNIQFDETVRAVMREYIQTNCIFRTDPEKQYALNLPKGKIYGQRPGDYNTWLVMLRRFLHNPKMLYSAANIIVLDMTIKMESGELPKDFQICGMETGSLPLIAAIQTVAMRVGKEINSFTIRKERKSYGLFNMVDGVPNEHPIVPIDDFINSGGSIRRCLETAHHEFGLKTAGHAYSIVQNYINAVDATAFSSLFQTNDFDFKFNPEQYWLPEDCNKSINKRPDYF